MLLWRTNSTSGEPTDLELLLRTHRGHEASARLLWQRLGPRLTAIAAALARRHGGDAAAADIVQGVFCLLLESDRETLARIADVPAYLALAVRNASLNHIRAFERRNHHIGQAAGAREAGGQRATEPQHARDPDELGAAMEKLDPEQRELIILKHAGELTFDQMARTLDQNRSTIATRYAVAIGRLRELLYHGLVKEGAR